MAHTDTALGELAAGKYLLLTTFRRDGRAVPTPVWVMLDGRTLAVWSAADAGKVKRIRNGGRVTVGPCDWRGKPLGASTPGFAEVLTPEASAHFAGLMKRKYGLAARVGLLGSRLSGGSGRAVGIRIRLDE
ncbi:PPOX class F420-dependent oxidoreductase [Streptomyces katsurahamanus]|uniref:PPOX class F420-dependent oxidoreductase n=1 Tax=Streptomyces katsurahamanus TaxID=2577098 RepID=A0ABW9NRI1_9ACTN|nr:PPOX class F420-dependent oxidoreductase [Streptomyces katsurahamanus]MQS35916.1 PPOX class F420-dependent oxidoreductase [Streptomyces katsurahamanus]